MANPSEDDAITSYRLLLECEHSKRVLECTTTVEALQSVIEEEVRKIVGAQVDLVLDVAEQRPDSRAIYLLQRFSTEWGEYVDVIDAISIDTKERLRAIALPVRAKSQSKVEGDASTKIESIISRVKKPTTEEAQVLSNLFPSSSGLGKRPKFDPHDDCVAGPSHKKKKKFGKPAQKNTPKPTTVEVVALKRFQTRLPKGRERKGLQSQGLIAKVKLHRNMTAAEVKQKIAEKFTDLPEFVFLECEDGCLTHCDADFDGEKAVNRRGAVYICRCTKDTKNQTSSDQTKKELSKGDVSSSDEFEEKMPNKQCKEDPIILSESEESGPDSVTPIQRTLKRVDGIISELNEQKHCLSDSDNDLPSVSTSLNTKENILESRAIRVQQDEQYEETLRADMAKVEERKQVEETMARKEQVHQTLKSKWQMVMSRSNSDGFKFTVRYPASRVECCIPWKSTAKDLYEIAYAFSPDFRADAFDLYILIPRQFVQYTDTSIGELNLGLSPVFVIEEGSDRLPFLSSTPQCHESSPSDGYSVLLELLAGKTEDYMNTLETDVYSPNVVNRERLYDDVTNLYRTRSQHVLKQYPFTISYENERAHDTGGVSRDMFSQFWSEACLKCFDGGNVLVPAINPHTDTSDFPLLGTILSHGFLVANFLPLRIAFPSLAAMLLGPTVLIPDSILVDTFTDYLSTYESAYIRDILVLIKEQQPRAFTTEQTKTLVDILSRMECREIPNPCNLKHLIVQVAKHEFLSRPLGALYAFNSGVPTAHRPFWNEIDVGELYSWYKSLNASPKRVIDKLEENVDVSAAESRVFRFLVAFIGDLNQEELRNFLRYVTGSSVLICERIKVTFNGVSGLGRSPIGHTCDSCLELPTTYLTYPEFKQEFLNILSSTVAWPMDAV